MLFFLLLLYHDNIQNQPNQTIHTYTHTHTHTHTYMNVNIKDGETQPLIPLVSPLATPLLSLHVPQQRLLNIAQTPLILTLGLA